MAVQEHAVKILNQNQKIVFVTSNDIMQRPNLIDEARNSGYKIVTVPDRLKEKIKGVKDHTGNTITDLSHFVTLYNESFEFHFVDTKDLTEAERTVYNFTQQIFRIAGGKPEIINEVRISETMRMEFETRHETLGLWDTSTRNIVIKRSQLSSLSDYAGTLLHEAVHAKSGFRDVSRDFERELTKLIGAICVKAIEKQNSEENESTSRPSLFKRFF